MTPLPVSLQNKTIISLVILVPLGKMSASFWPLSRTSSLPFVFSFKHDVIMDGFLYFFIVMLGFTKPLNINSQRVFENWDVERYCPLAQWFLLPWFIRFSLLVPSVETSFMFIRRLLGATLLFLSRILFSLIFQIRCYSYSGFSLLPYRQCLKPFTIFCLFILSVHICATHVW